MMPGRWRSSGRDLGISKERVRQIEHRALEKLKVSLLERSVERDSAVRALLTDPAGTSGARPQPRRE